jgi:parallel beta-helix repeat protein
MYKLKAPQLVLVIIIGLALTANAIKLNSVKSAPAIKNVPDDYSTIQAAINDANSGDTILVSAGIYRENLVIISKNISIIGENASTTVIDSKGSGDAVLITRASIVFSGFTVQNGTESYSSGISLYECDSATIYGNIFKGNNYGLQLTNSNNSRIFNNTIMNNTYAGVYIHDGSSGNIFFENTIANNSIGVWCTSSPQNIFYHNNFMNNINQLSIFNSPTTWDYGNEGNFWSDYDGGDENLDGLGDSEYYVGDRYPLMGKFVNYTFQHYSRTYFLAVISNSTISNFQFDEVNGRIELYVLGPNNTIGFCRLAASKSIFHDGFVILVDGNALFVKNWTDNTYIYCYTNYTHTGTYRKITISVDIQKNEPPSYLVPVVIGAVLMISGILTIVYVKRMRKKVKGFKPKLSRMK